MRKSSFSIMALAFLLIAGLTFATQALAGSHSGNNGLHGKIVSVAQDGSSMVIQGGGKSQQITVTFNSHVSVTVDGKVATVADLKPGFDVKISPNSDNASVVQAKSPPAGAAPADNN